MTLFQRWVTALNGEGSMQEWYYELFSWIFTPELLSDQVKVSAMLDTVVAYPYRQSAIDFAAQVKAIDLFEVTALLADIRCPALIICGSEDRLFPPAESRQILAGIQGRSSVLLLVRRTLYLLRSRMNL